VRREFRAVYLIEDEAQRDHAITDMYLKFEALYGVSRTQIRDIVKKVKSEHRSEIHRPKPPKATGAQPKPKRHPMTCWPWHPRFQPQPTSAARTQPNVQKPKPRKKCPVCGYVVMITKRDRFIVHQPPNAKLAKGGRRLKNCAASNRSSTWKPPYRAPGPTSGGSIRTVGGGLPGLGRRR
jgi:hypothetical protein